MENNNNKKTSLGLDENIEGLLCYAFGWVTGIIFLLIEKESKFVKFHAAQSIITFLGLYVISFALKLIPFIGGLVSMIIWPLYLILWIVLMVKAYRGEMYKLFIVGDICEQQINKNTINQ